MIRRFFFALLACLTLSSFLTLPAFAQDEGASVVILRFERFNVDDDAMSTFYETLETSINEHADMTVKTGGEITIQDVILTAGCDEPTVECLSGLRDAIGADQIVFGSVQRSDDVYLFTIRNFDFAEGRFIREVTDQTVQGSASDVERAMPAIVENFLYGPVGTLEVTVSGADSPEVLLNGEKMGRAPTTLESLPLGEHVVTLKTEDGEEQSQTVILRHNEPGTLDFQFEGSAIAEPVVASGSGPSTVPGWIFIGVGVAATGFGVFEMLEVASIDDEFDALCAAEGNVCSGGSAALGSPADAARAKELEDDGSLAKTLQLVGFSVGGVALVTGTVLLIRAYSHDGSEIAEEDMADGSVFDDVDISVAPTQGGAAAGVSWTF